MNGIGASAVDMKHLTGAEVVESPPPRYHALQGMFFSFDEVIHSLCENIVILQHVLEVVVVLVRGSTHPSHLCLVTSRYKGLVLSEYHSDKVRYFSIGGATCIRGSAPPSLHPCSQWYSFVSCAVRSFVHCCTVFCSSNRLDVRIGVSPSQPNAGAKLDHLVRR